MQYLLFSFWLHSVWQSLGPSTSLQMVRFHSFLWPSNIPLYICTESESEWKSLSCTTLCNPMDCIVLGILQARILEWVAVPFPQGIFPIQGLNSGLPHFRRILYQLSHQGSPRILEWVAYPLSSGSFQPRNWTRVSCTAGGFFTNWAMRKSLHLLYPFICWWMNWDIGIGIYTLLHVK